MHGKDSRVIAIRLFCSFRHNDYGNKLTDLQQRRNELVHNKALSSDNWPLTQIYDKQIKETDNAIKELNTQSSSLPNLQEGQILPKEYRENLQSSLFNTAFKEQMGEAWAFDQKKTELKSNQATMDKVRLAQQNSQFAQMYNLHLAELGIKEKEEALKENEFLAKYSLLGSTLNGPASNAPMSVVDTKNDVVVTNTATEKANAAYIKASDDFITQPVIIL